MILYNITVIIDDAIEHAWLIWINDTFVPQALSSNLLVSNRLLRVLDSPNEGKTYCLQFIADSLEDYQSFQNNFSAALLEAHTLQFKNQSVYFSTAMEFIT